MSHLNSTLSSRRVGAVKPVMVCDQNRLDTLSGFGRRLPDSRENYDRREVQMSRHCWREAPWRPSEVTSNNTSMVPRRPSHVGTKPVKMEDDGQQHVGQSLPVCRAQAGKRADIVTLRKHLGQSRRLASAIKRGQSYIHLLQKGEEEEREEEERQRRRREEQKRTQPRPPSFSSDSDSDSDACPLTSGTSWSGVNVTRPRRKKKSQSAWPFTPVHHSLTSPLLSEAPREVIYRQLCCLNWLLEALTVDVSGRVGPLTACWDTKDPGRGRTAIKTLKKEKAIQSKWEQFVSTKPKRVHLGRPLSSSARPHTQRISSCLSVASVSAPSSTTVTSSVSSPVPGHEDDTLSTGAAEKETDRPHSDDVHRLSDVHQKVKKERQAQHTSCLSNSLTALESKTHRLPQRTAHQTGSMTAKSSRPKSCPSKPLLTGSHLISSKATVLQELKAAFDERVEEEAQSYVHILELKARERLNSGLRRYHALGHMTEPSGLSHHVTYCTLSHETEAPNDHNKNKPGNNMWLSTLLSSLPEEVCREQGVSRVLEKLSGFAEQQTLRVKPQLFLKVLGGLEPWELCLPELCVAIQIATEHVVQMPREEYDVWLRSRVSLPSQLHSDPHTPGETHSLSPGEKAAGMEQQLKSTLPH